MTDETLYWPMTFKERNLAEDVRLLPEHIRDYAYQPGDPRRYTSEGWGIWQEIVRVRRA